MDMNDFTPELVDFLAGNLLIGLSEEENSWVLKELKKCDEAIKRLIEVDNIGDIEPMTHCLDNFVYELREDVAEESVPVDDLLSNCDSYIDTEIKVPKVVG